MKAVDVIVRGKLCAVLFPAETAGFSMEKLKSRAIRRYFNKAVEHADDSSGMLTCCI